MFLAAQSLNNRLKKIGPGSVLFFLPALLVYFPAFVTSFGIHNDYRFLPGNFTDHKVFLEAPHLFLVGRALQAGLIVFQGWLIERISDFNLARLLSFLMMLVFAGMFDRFLRRELVLPPFWSRVIVLQMMALPSSQIYVLWTAHFLPGFVTLLWAQAAYVLYTASREKDRSAAAGPVAAKAVRWGAWGLFLAALFLYPINATFVFLLIFLRITFSPALSDLQRFRQAVKETLFFGSAMAVYFVMNVFWILPLAPASLVSEHALAGTRYDFSFGAELYAKGALIRQTFVVALAGVWHGVWGDRGAWLTAGLLGGGLVLFFLLRKKSKSRAAYLANGYLKSDGLSAEPFAEALDVPQRGTSSLNTQPFFVPPVQAADPRLVPAGHPARKGLTMSGLRFILKPILKNSLGTPRIFRMFLLGGALFVLMNVPAFLAKGCSQLIGYRVLFASAVLFLVLQSVLWQRCASLMKGRWPMGFIKGLAVALVTGSGWAAASHVNAAVKNYGRELSFLQEKFLATDFQKTTRHLVVTVPEDQTSLDRKMYYEFTYMMNLADMAFCVAENLAQTKGRAILPVSVDDGDVIFADERTQVIDLNAARTGFSKNGPFKTTKPLARVRTSALLPMDIVRRKGAYFSFQERAGEQRPFWLIDVSKSPAPWFEVAFEKTPQMVRGFSFAVFGSAEKKSLPVACRLKASLDGQTWYDIDVRQVSQGQLRFYKVEQPARYRFYRFVLVPEGGAAQIAIPRFHLTLRFKNEP